MSTRMIEVKTAELEGAPLDYAVAQVSGQPIELGEPSTFLWVVSDVGSERYSPSTDWAQGGPLIESNPWVLPYRATHRYHIGAFEACTPAGFPHNGKTPLIAACRAIVAAKLGDSVMVPVELVNP